MRSIAPAGLRLLNFIGCLRLSAQKQISGWLSLIRALALRSGFTITLSTSSIFRAIAKACLLTRHRQFALDPVGRAVVFRLARYLAHRLTSRCSENTRSAGTEPLAGAAIGVALVRPIREPNRDVDEDEFGFVVVGEQFAERGKHLQLIVAVGIESDAEPAAPTAVHADEQTRALSFPVHISDATKLREEDDLSYRPVA